MSTENKLTPRQTVWVCHSYFTTDLRDALDTGKAIATRNLNK